MVESYHSEIDHEEEYGPQRSVDDRDLCEDEDETYGTDAAHNDAIVIAVDGACRNNGRPNATGAIGVFLHRDNYWNEAALCDDHLTPTNQRAELFAGLRGLKIATSIRERNHIPRHRPIGPYRRLRRVLIKSDSMFLVKGMTEWIYKWRQNGYINTRGSTVCNHDLFQQLEAAVEELNDMDVQVQFWHVPRAENAVADRLANAALDGESVDDALEEYFEGSEDTSYDSDDWY